MSTARHDPFRDTPLDATRPDEGGGASAVAQDDGFARSGSRSRPARPPRPTMAQADGLCRTRPNRAAQSRQARSSESAASRASADVPRSSTSARSDGGAQAHAAEGLSNMDAGSPRTYHQPDAMAEVCRLEESVQRRAYELRADVVMLQVARRELVCRESERDLLAEAEEDLNRFECLLHAKAEQALAGLERSLCSARSRCDHVVAEAEAGASELRGLRSSVLGWLSDLEDAARLGEDEVRRAAQAAVAEQQRRKKERIAVEMRLLLGEMRGFDDARRGPSSRWTSHS